MGEKVFRTLIPKTWADLMQTPLRLAKKAYAKKNSHGNFFEKTKERVVE